MNATTAQPPPAAIIAQPSWSAGAFACPRHILVPVDFSAASQRSLHYAGALADCFGAAMTVLHVVEPPLLPEWGYTHLVRRDDRLRALAESRLLTFASERSVSTPHGLRRVVRCGEPELQIFAAARELACDLIVIATHGYSVLPHCLLGNTAEQVVRRAPCPVWTVRGPVAEDDCCPVIPPLRHLLVATDFSEETRKTLCYGVALAREFNATLHVAHVVPTVLPADVSHLSILSQEPALKEAARREMERLRTGEIPADIRVQTSILAGNPFFEINKEAERVCAGLIIVSTHGYTGLRYMLLGCTAQRIVQYARVPVLVVREHETEFIPAAEPTKEGQL